MSIVKYFNKKLNCFLIYEYSSSKDPVTQKRKVTRKYLGSEDAVSHIFTPSSGKRGRPPKEVEHTRPEEQIDQNTSKIYASLCAEIEELKQKLNNENNMNLLLQNEKQRLEKTVSQYEDLIDSVKQLLNRNIGSTGN